MNYAFQLAFIALKTANPGAPPLNAPVIFFDPTTQLFKIIVDSSYSATIPAPASTIKIFMNSKLYNLFNTFESIAYGSGLPNGLDNQLIISINNNYYPIPSTQVLKY